MTAADAMLRSANRFGDGLLLAFGSPEADTEARAAARCLASVLLAQVKQG